MRRKEGTEVKIVRHGKTKLMDRRFNCVKCGCIWDAEALKLEYTHIKTADDSDYFTAKCPECQTISYDSRPIFIEETPIYSIKEESEIAK